MPRIHRGDVVTVLSGKDKGKSGKVLHVWPELDRAMVEGINLVKHFDRRTQQNQAGGVVAREGRIALSKLSLSCPRCRKPVRTGVQLNPDGSKQRICRRCKDVIGAAA